MEEGRFGPANDIKVQLEQQQRARRKTMEAMGAEWTPRWFTREEREPDTGEPYWRYLGGYWEIRRTQAGPESQRQSWDEVVDIYRVESESGTSSVIAEDQASSSVIADRASSSVIAEDQASSSGTTEDRPSSSDTTKEDRAPSPNRG